MTPATFNFYEHTEEETAVAPSLSLQTDGELRINPIVAQIFGSTLHAREAAKQLLQMVAESSCRQVELDFLDVQYISRSFADRFHADKMELTTVSQKAIVVVNATGSVVNMLQTVARTQNKSYRTASSLPVLKYTDRQQPENFLLPV